MKTILTTAAIALSTFGAHAADKPMQIESWSFGCTSPAMATQQGSSPQARAGYDLKTNKGARMATPGEATTGAADACLNGLPPGQPVLRESPSKASLGKSKELTGHVTLVK